MYLWHQVYVVMILFENIDFERYQHLNILFVIVPIQLLYYLASELLEIFFSVSEKKINSFHFPLNYVRFLRKVTDQWDRARPHQTCLICYH